VPGVYRVEILGQSELGIAVVANFPVYVGEPPPSRIQLGPHEAPVTDSDEAARRLLAMANRERAVSGQVPLTFDAELSKVAAAHVADMLAHGFVGHTSPTTGGASDRVAHAGIRTSLVLENIGRGYSLGEVHAGLMESPGHRGNLLNPQATHVGIAVAVRDEGGHVVYLVTQLFIRVNPKLTANAPRALLTEINRERARRGRQELQRDEALEGVASGAAGSCFAGSSGSDASVMRAVQDGLRKLESRKGGVSALLSLASGLSDLAQIDAVLAPDVRRIGVGMVQGTRPDTPPNTVCAVLLLAQ
jgi:uncharacterized protein YkwD